MAKPCIRGNHIGLGIMHSSRPFKMAPAPGFGSGWLWLQPLRSKKPRLMRTPTNPKGTWGKLCCFFTSGILEYLSFRPVLWRCGVTQFGGRGPSRGGGGDIPSSHHSDPIQIMLGVPVVRKRLELSFPHASQEVERVWVKYRGPTTGCPGKPAVCWLFDVDPYPCPCVSLLLDEFQEQGKALRFCRTPARKPETEEPCGVETWYVSKAEFRLNTSRLKSYWDGWKPPRKGNLNMTLTLAKGEIKGHPVVRPCLIIF